MVKDLIDETQQKLEKNKEKYSGLPDFLKEKLGETRKWDVEANYSSYGLLF